MKTCSLHRPQRASRALCAALTVSTLALAATSTAWAQTMNAGDGVRFLRQASFGATPADLRLLQTGQVRDRRQWIGTQLVMPSSTNYFDSVRQAQQMFYLANPGAQADKLPAYADHHIWHAYLTAPDQLRKRVGYALSQILVVGRPGLAGGLEVTALLQAGYLDLLEQHAFGNFQDLLRAVSKSPAMGMYLSSRSSSKTRFNADGAKISVPDENYARELMQLFTIGLVKLDIKGNPQVGTETYTQEDVTRLARVFTGWRYDGPISDRESLRRPMKADPNLHSTTEDKNFLGSGIAPGDSADTSLEKALTLLAQHENTAPFISKQLIQRLVTSNPSPDYVGRVATVFRQTQGNLGAVVQALLLDDEAVNGPAPGTVPHNLWGKVTEPVLRYTSLARALQLKSSTPVFVLGSMNNPGSQLGQTPMHSPSVFNFYRPGYVPPPRPNSSGRSYLAPELQILTETSVAGTVNHLMELANKPQEGTAAVGAASDGLMVDYTPFTDARMSPEAQLGKLHLLLANRSLDSASLDSILQLMKSVGGTKPTPEDMLKRARLAAILVMAHPDAIVLK